MTPIIPSLSPLFDFLLPRNISGTDFGTGYGGTVCGFHTRPFQWGWVGCCFHWLFSDFLAPRTRLPNWMEQPRTAV